MALPSLAVVIVALAERRAAPPPKVSLVPSALVRVTAPCTPPESEALMKPSWVSATQTTLSGVAAVRPPPVPRSLSVGVGVVPSGDEALPPRIIASSPSISDSRPVLAAMARMSSKPCPAYCASKSTEVSTPMPL